MACRSLSTRCLPIQSEKPDTHFRRLMIAQDTGGAIVGPARADIYLGAGEEAARAAGRFKHFGKMAMLVPNELDRRGAARRGFRCRCRNRRDGEEAMTVEFVPVTSRPKQAAGASRDGQIGRRPRPPLAESKPQTDASAGKAKVAERVETTGRERRGARFRSIAEGPAAPAQAMSGEGGRKGRRLSQDEHSLWQGVTRAIKPLRKRAAPPEIENDKSDDKPASRKPQRVVAVAAPPPKPNAPAPAPLDRRLKQKIARGNQSIDAPARSAWMTQAEAHAALLRFLRGVAGQRRDGGAGDHRQGRARMPEGGRGVLKRMVPMWLRLPEFSGYVVGFGDAAIRPWRRGRALCAAAQEAGLENKPAQIRIPRQIADILLHIIAVDLQRLARAVGGGEGNFVEHALHHGLQAARADILHR